ncbi:hypothetical protein GXM_00863 [Nostoc sphaeroides CCNUC1]|uniref:Uncharacterized protein n=1 Tax=Nostoc sphaeroides CCNUC1 TaxID=2653204 RepID=A0A5P8VSQ9_9NOSO|nr:hypothetical protein GXM_00863 [Nostoc sphaeroides CCNUC1]
MFSNRKQIQTNSPVFLSKCKNPSIVIGTSWLKEFNWLALLFRRFAVSSYSGTSPDCQISRQPKHRAQVLIDHILNGRFTCYLGFNLLISIVASIRKRFQCRLDLSDLFRCGIKLANQCQYLFHEYNYITGEKYYLTAKKKACALPPYLKKGASTARGVW